MVSDSKIVYVSRWESMKLHSLSFLYGLHLVVKRFMKWAWNPSKFFVMQQRDKSPSCLVDNNLGKHSYVKIKGVKFHYVESGDKDKPLILLLHGFPDCWLSWREQIPCLAQHYRVVALDLKGFGDSDKPSRRRLYEIQILVEELKQFILALGVNTCSIIGHDVGGLLGWYMVATHAEMVNKFVAISCPHPNIYWNRVSGNAALDEKWMHFSRLPFLPEMDALKEDLSIINDIFQHLKIDKISNEKEYVEAYKYAFSRKEDWTGPINYYRTLPFTRLSTENCEQISIRSLLIVGNMDPTVTIESVIQSSEYIEQFSVKIVNEARHFPHQEKPDIVNKTIIKFFMGVIPNEEKIPQKSAGSFWLSPLSNTFKYSNQVYDVVQNRANEVANIFPNKILFLSTRHVEQVLKTAYKTGIRS